MTRLGRQPVSNSRPAAMPEPIIDPRPISERLAELEPFISGRIITVPLELWPEYIQRERLSIDLSRRSPLGNVYVKQEAPRDE